MTGPDPDLAALRAGLVAAAGRLAAQRRRRRRARGMVVGVLAALVGTLAIGAPTTTPAAADVVVRVDDHEVFVLLVDLEHDPARIEAAIRGAGLDATVDGLPVGPSLVGRFLGRSTLHSRTPALRTVDGDERSFAGFALPVGWPGSLRLQVGVPAAGDEPYARFSDALAPGEALACRPLVGRSGRDVAAELAREPLTVRYVALADDGMHPVTAVSVERGSGSRWTVAGVDGVRRGEVAVRLVPEGSGAHVPRGLPEGCRP